MAPKAKKEAAKSNVKVDKIFDDDKGSGLVADKTTKKPVEDEFDDSFLPKKNSFRVEETARYFDVSERTVRLWIQHGHLASEKVVGTIMITRKSILRCRFGQGLRGGLKNPRRI